MKNGRYRPHDDFFEIVAGRQTEILDALGIEWNRARPNQHIRCPYPGHEDKKPSWRWDPASGKAFCTCGTADITGVVMKMRGVDWKAARDYCREVLGAGPFQPQRRQPNDLALRSAVEPEPKQAKPEPAILTPDEFRQAPTLFPEPARDAQQYRRDDIPTDDVGRQHIYCRGTVPVVIKQRLKSGEPKFLPWYRVKGGWQNRKPDGFRPLPYVAENCDPFHRGAEGPLFWAEGEHDVDTLASHELDAFTFGASGVVPVGAEAYIEGRAVIIPAHNDDAGERDAEAKLRACHGHAGSIKVLRLPGLGEKQDVTDWLESHSLAELQAEIAATPEWKDSTKAERDGTPNHQNGGSGKSTTNGEKRLVVRNADEVEPEPVEWLWPGRIATGKSTLIGGDPGLGKSQLSIFIAATMTCAGEWPCREGRPATKRSVVMLSAEDGVADTIVPRLMAVGADRAKVKIVTAVHEADGAGRRIFNLTRDLDVLEKLITEIGDVGLVIIDPVDAYIGGNVDSHKNAAVRAVLEPISELADRLGVAIMALTHFSKQAGGKAIYRFIGSIAHIGAARIAFAVAADPENKGRILLLHAKNNLAAPQKGLAFRVEQRLVAGGIIGSSITFEQEYATDISADEALQSEGGAGQTTAKDAAAELLLTVLAKGRVSVPDIEAEARAAGVLGADQRVSLSKPFRSACDELHVVKTREGFGPGASHYWSLPEAALEAPSTMLAHDKKRATMGNEGNHGAENDGEGNHGGAEEPSMVALDHHTCPHFEKGNHEGGEGNHEEGGGCGPIGPETGAAKGETT